MIRRRNRKWKIENGKVQKRKSFSVLLFWRLRTQANIESSLHRQLVRGRFHVDQFQIKLNLDYVHTIDFNFQATTVSVCGQWRLSIASNALFAVIFQEIWFWSAPETYETTLTNRNRICHREERKRQSKLKKSNKSKTRAWILMKFHFVVCLCHTSFASWWKLTSFAAWVRRSERKIDKFTRWTLNNKMCEWTNDEAGEKKRKNEMRHALVSWSKWNSFRVVDTKINEKFGNNLHVNYSYFSDSSHHFHVLLVGWNIFIANGNWYFMLWQASAKQLNGNVLRNVPNHLSASSVRCSGNEKARKNGIGKNKFDWNLVPIVL